MKICICLYHNNLNNINPEWICQCLKSIKNQSVNINDYYFIELDYKKEELYPISLLELDYFKNINKENKIKITKFFNTQEEVINYCFNYAFNILNIDVCFNINIENYYNNDRFKIQLNHVINGYDLIVSNIIMLNNDKIIKKTDLNITNNTDNDLFIKIKYQNKKNIIDFSTLCINKKAWSKIKEISTTKYLNGYLIMKKILQNNIKLMLCKEHLVYKRIN